MTQRAVGDSGRRSYVGKLAREGTFCCEAADRRRNPRLQRLALLTLMSGTPMTSSRLPSDPAEVDVVG